MPAGVSKVLTGVELGNMRVWGYLLAADERVLRGLIRIYLYRRTRTHPTRISTNTNHRRNWNNGFPVSTSLLHD